MPPSRLMYAASGSDADMLYATGFFADDPFLWWETRGKTHIALSPLEIDRARPVARVSQVHAVGEFVPAAARDRSTTAAIVAMAGRYRVGSFLVPEQFPAGLLEKLRRTGLKITVSEEPFFPQRWRKTKEEIAALSAALRVAETGLRRGINVLKASRSDRRGFLKWGGVALTSERLRAEMDSAVLHAGGSPANTIVAGGDQGCDPHERGHGPLRAHEAIVLDIFPRHAGNHYFGDLTRTVARGRASDALRKQYATVREGKRWVMKQMRAGADGAALQEELIGRFKAAGYPTEQRRGRWVGMFHGVGHGLGLDLHETPRFAAGKLFPGLSITVEPGLYYPGVGGVRIEDVVIVGPAGVRNLTKFEEELELR
ncbi:MAG TPA: M24 family metallopeptidase [Candidatus Methylacidiphilales bacterium]|nr:M24 family metallopeptidase [Candidatus Methylacidiphilales bacterium]